MKVSALLPLAALSAAIVIPEQNVMSEISIESDKTTNSVFDNIKSKIPSKDEILELVEDSASSVIDGSKNALDNAIDWASDSYQAATQSLEEEYFDAKGWLESAQFEVTDGRHHHDDPHHGEPPHHGKPPHRRPQHPHNPNKTVYELINESKYATKLAGLINDDQELVDLLNSTTANFTVFAPIDKAFEKIPDHGHKPSKELIRKVLSYHISSDFYPAGRVLVTKTVPTLLDGEYLSDDPKSTPQRLSTNIGLKGLTVNYNSRIVGLNLVRPPLPRNKTNNADSRSLEATASSTPSTAS